MSFEFWVFLIIGAIGVIALIARRGVAKTTTMYSRATGKEVETPNPVRRTASLVAFSVLGVAGLFLFLSCFTIVGTKNIGIQTAFNRPVGTMANGWNWKAPWTEVHEWDGKLQNLRFSDTDIKDVDEDGPGVSVRLANQSTATVDLIFQYRITDDEGTLNLFRDYGNEVSVKKNQVQKALQAAVNRAFGDYDPITALAKSADRSPTQGMPELAAEALTTLRGSDGLPQGLEAVSLTIVMPHYDGQTEERIKAFNAAIQDTAIATQREQTAAAIKRANDILAQSNASAAVLYQNCLDMVERVVKTGGALPAGFSCSSGGSVVIPAAK